jgi:hypothetical protein
MYAWSPILAGDKSAAMGDKVSKSSLGVDDADFDAMVEAGSIRSYPVPDMPEGFQGSVVDHLRAEIQKATDMSTEIASFNLGGSYFGPTAEEVMLDPDSANAAEAAAKEEEEAKK